MKADTKHGADTILDKENHAGVLSGLGVTAEKALALWTEAGKPVINLGPGENCFNLEKLLSNRDINERHIAAIKTWLAGRTGKHEEKESSL